MFWHLAQSTQVLSVGEGEPGQLHHNSQTSIQLLMFIIAKVRQKNGPSREAKRERMNPRISFWAIHHRPSDLWRCDISTFVSLFIIFCGQQKSITRHESLWEGIMIADQIVALVIILQSRAVMNEMENITRLVNVSFWCFVLFSAFRLCVWARTTFESWEKEVGVRLFDNNTQHIL